MASFNKEAWGTVYTTANRSEALIALKDSISFEGAGHCNFHASLKSGDEIDMKVIVPTGNGVVFRLFNNETRKVEQFCLSYKEIKSITLRFYNPFTGEISDIRTVYESK